MTHSPLSITEEHDQLTPVARIDSEDQTSFDNVRKFLESYGCRVAEVTHISHRLAYYLVIGSVNFVKTILAGKQWNADRTFVIVKNCSDSDLQYFSTIYNTRIWVVDALPLSAEMIDVLFAFFFTDQKLIGGSMKRVPHEEQQPVLKEVVVVDTSLSKHHEPIVAPVISKEPQETYSHSIDEEWDKRKASIDVLVKQLSQSHRDHEKEVVTGSTKKHERTSQNIFSGIKIRFGNAKMFLILILCATTLYIGSVIGFILFFSLSQKSLLQGDIDMSSRYSTLSHICLTPLEKTVTLSQNMLSLIGAQHYIKNQHAFISLASNSILSISYAQDILRNSARLAPSLLLQGSSGADAPALAFARIQQDVSQAQKYTGISYALMQELLDAKPFPLTIPLVMNKFQRSFQSLGSMRRTLDEFSHIVQVYPLIAGYKERKTYLVLLQNSAELRPTGGFIGSVALVAFEDGSLRDMSVQDVYALDGQLTGHVDPPMQIRELMSQEHWYLRDSNWDPDFAKTGSKASWFYQKETGVTVDGVIAVSSPVIVQILKEIGPVTLSDYNDTITADNFYAKSLYYTQSNFFPGSTQKKDFLGALMSSLVSRITSGKVSPYGMEKAFGAALRQGNILFWFSDPKIEEIVSAFGWSGSLPDSVCFEQEKNCVADLSVQIDANIGVNKVNYFIQKSREHSIFLTEDGSITEESSSIYHNSSAVDNPVSGSGVYKNYSRWYIPKDASVSAIMIGGKKIPIRDTSKKAVPELPYAEIDRSDNRFTIVGVAFTVREQQEERVTVQYRRNQTIPFVNTIGRLRLYYAVQPGNSENQRVLVSYPTTWSLIASPKGTVTEQVANTTRVSYNNETAKTELINFSFKR